MSREFFDHRPEQLEAYTQTLDSVADYYTYQEPENARMAAAAKGQALLLGNNPEFRTWVGAVHAAHEIKTGEPIPPQYAFHKLLRNIQLDAMLHNPRNYPFGYTDAVAWANHIETILASPRRYDISLQNSVEREIQSNIPQRYKSIKLLNALYGDRFPDGPSVLDVGSSVMHGGLMLALQSEDRLPGLKFRDIEVADFSRNTKNHIDAHTTALANIALSQTVRFGEIRGVDITDINDPQVRLYVMGCSFKPDELQDESRREEYEMLDRIYEQVQHNNPDSEELNLHFFKGDFNSDEDIRRMRETFADRQQKFDIIVFSTVLYQHTTEQRNTMLATALNLLSPTGLIVIQDAPDGDFEKPYNYITTVIDSTDATLKEHEMFRWRNGRCGQVVLGDGVLWNGHRDKAGNKVYQSIGQRLREIED